MTDGSSARERSYGTLADGCEVRLFTLTNSQGMKARVMEYGAILVSLEAPDREGRLADLTLGFDTLDEWVRNNAPCFGSTIGRYGNRIAKGYFSLDGIRHQLATNSESGGIPCHLHGGTIGFNQVLWQGRLIDNQRVELSYLSEDGEEGYPGNLQVTVTYTLNDDNELIWEARATTDAPTVLNLLHHSYWNLSGDPTRDILDHRLTLHADRYLPTDKGMIPTGEFAPLAGTPLDFTHSNPIGSRIDDDLEALRYGSGYDHCWVLRDGEGIRPAARVEEPKSGRVMEVLTNQRGIQFYTANFLDGSVPGKGGVAYRKRSALCLETQNFPDAPNQPDFPSPVLRPGESYHHVMVHRFSNVS